MDAAATLDAPYPPEVVFPWVAELERYPTWLDIVRAVEPAGDGAWTVDLRARLGPFSRSKRLRMVRDELIADRRARFVREELDGREHSLWVLEADVAPSAGGGSTVRMALHYGGGGLPAAVDRILSGEIERCKERLLEVIAGASEPTP